MKSRLFLVLALLLLASNGFADFKDGPVVVYGPYEASGVSAIVTFAPAIPVTQILDAALPGGAILERLSAWDGTAHEAKRFSNLKAFAGSDFSHGVVTFSAEHTLESMLESLRSLPHIESADPNYFHRPLYVPNDPFFSDYQDNFKQIYVREAWDISQGEGAVVAVIDSGYRTSGQEDSATRLLTGYDFWGEDNNVNDFIGHGTHVSNVIVEATNNGIGCAGIAFKASLLPCKVFPDWDDGAYENDIIQAINWAVDQGADVINMSLGGGGYVKASEEAIQNAVDNDCIVFAASGNDGQKNVNYPARHTPCVAVGACNQHRVGGTPTRALFSNYGAGLDIVAPGVFITQEGWGSSQGQGYYSASGTSSSSPHAAAVAALLVGKGGADAPAIREAIESTAYNPNGEWTDGLGFGEINAFEALRVYSGNDNELPVAIAKAYPTTGGGPLTVQFDGSESYDPDGEVVAYRWVLNSKILSDQESFSFTFDQDGDYTVYLKITDDSASTGEDAVEIAVDDSLDVCFQMLDTVYLGCDLAILGAEGDYLTNDQALADCRGTDHPTVWSCLLECFDLADGCSEYRDCALEKCDIQTKYTVSGGGDDDEFLCGLCG